LKALYGLLGAKDNLDRFLETCVRPSDMAHTEHTHFNRGLPAIAEWRWRTVLNLLQKLLPSDSREGLSDDDADILTLQKILSSVWSRDHFVNGRAAAPPPPAGGAANAEEEPGAARQRAFGGDAVHELNFVTLTSTIGDVFWWQVADTFLLAHMLGNELGDWAEGCPCHRLRNGPWASRFHAVLEHLHIISSDGPFFQCPRGGTRAQEMAAGAIFQVFDLAASYCWQRVLQRCNSGLTQVQRQKLFRMFEDLKSLVLANLHLKFDYFQRLPWRLLALAHWDPAIVRATALEAIALFDGYPVQNMNRPESQSMYTCSQCVRK
jgi:hypothetical protein